MKTSQRQELLALCSQYKAEVNRILVNKKMDTNIGYNAAIDIGYSIYLTDIMKGNKVVGTISTHKNLAELQKALRDMHTLLNTIY